MSGKGRAYYNEIEPGAAEMLRLAMAEGLIPQGEVDERSIEDVSADDLRRFRQVHLFAGTGGWAYAARLAGWPDDRELWTWSCPCQPFSGAGLGRGFDDPRHLFPHVLRLITVCRPATNAGEQSASALGRAWLAVVRASLEALGYAFGAADLCAASIGAPHARQRIFFAAHAQRHQQPRQEPCGRTAGRMGRVQQPVSWDTPWPRALAELRVLDAGLPRSVAATDAARNAIVPELAAEFLAAFVEAAGLMSLEQAA
jgi:DNA (cytosine-5)-methyltransferase 1